MTNLDGNIQMEDPLPNKENEIIKPLEWTALTWSSNCSTAIGSDRYTSTCQHLHNGSPSWWYGQSPLYINPTEIPLIVSRYPYFIRKVSLDNIGEKVIPNLIDQLIEPQIKLNEDTIEKREVFYLLSFSNTSQLECLSLQTSSTLQNNGVGWNWISCEKYLKKKIVTKTTTSPQVYNLPTKFHLKDIYGKIETKEFSLKKFKHNLRTYQSDINQQYNITLGFSRISGVSSEDNFIELF